MSTSCARPLPSIPLQPTRIAAAWGVVLVISVCYCELSALIFDAAPVALRTSALWAVETWSGWIVLTLCALHRMDHAPKRPFTPLRLACTAVSIFLLLLLVDALCNAILAALGLVARRPDALGHVYMRAPAWALSSVALPIALHWWRVKRAEISMRPQSEIQTSQPSSEASICVTTREGEIRVALSTLEAIESAGNYVQLCSHDGRTYLHRATLGDMLLFAKPHGWTRIHRTALVNTSHIRTRLAGYRLLLTSGRIVTIGRTYRPREHPRN